MVVVKYRHDFEAIASSVGLPVQRFDRKHSPGSYQQEVSHEIVCDGFFGNLLIGDRR